jgi:hypothetical protein
MLIKYRFRILILFIYSINALPFGSFSQTNFSLNYEEFDIYFRPQKCLDTTEFTLTGKYAGFKLKLYLKDCRGEARFELFDKKNDIKMSGNYRNAIDTLKKYRFARYLAQSDGIEKYRISTFRYLYPLKCGEWIYYEGIGKKKKSRIVTYIYSPD